MNLSAIAIRLNRLTILFAFFVVVAGTFSYQNLGRLEDPDFTIKTAIVSAQWPGATADEMQRQVADVIETEIQQMGQLKHLRSESKPGECTIWVDIKDEYWSDRLPQVWDILRRKVEASKSNLPQGIRGPYVNDDFGQVYGIMLGVTGDGFEYREMRDYVDKIKMELLLVEGVGRIEIFGIQDERIYLEAARPKLIASGIDPDGAMAAIQNQNVFESAGSVKVNQDRLTFYPTGTFQSLDDIGDSLVPTVGGGSVRVKDIGRVRRGYVEPAVRKMRFGLQGHPKSSPSLGLGISVVPGGNVVDMGVAVDIRLKELIAELPIGLEVHTIANQPEVVVASISEFTGSLVQAVTIVLIVLLFGLGMRIGIIVGMGIPLTILATFIGMLLMDIDLQRISLGALIIALGMLVDNSIVVCEMFLVRVQRGMDKLQAAMETYKQAAFPLMSATLTSVVAFLPMYLSPNSMGEYCSSLFIVVGISLLFSWFMAFTVTSLSCYNFLKVKQTNAAGEDPYNGAIYQRYRGFLNLILKRPVSFLIIMVGLFISSLFGFGFVKQLFFPDAVRNQFLIEMQTPEGTDIEITSERAEMIEEFLLKQAEVMNVTTFVGMGMPRFVLAISSGPSGSQLAEFIVNTKDYQYNQQVMQKTREFIAGALPNCHYRVGEVPMGAGGNYKIEIRITGPDQIKLRDYSAQVQAIMKADPRTKNVVDDWRRRVPAIIVDIDQDRARRAYVSSGNIASALNGTFVGEQIDIFRENNRQIPIIGVGSLPEERNDFQAIFNTQIPNATGSAAGVTLRQVAEPRLDWLESRISRRDKKLVIKPKCNAIPGVTAEEVRLDLAKKIEEQIKFEPGYSMEWGGEHEGSSESSGSVTAFLPIVFLAMVAILMLQFNSFRRVSIIFLTLPLAMIGVTSGLLVFNQPFGFIALLGLMSLMGIVINNGIVLIDQIDTNIAEGMSDYKAVIDASLSRMRPILLSTTTTVLGMIPLVMSGPFWRPMAVVIMSGLLFGTMLTLLVVPVLYKLFFKVEVEG